MGSEERAKFEGVLGGRSLTIFVGLKSQGNHVCRRLTVYLVYFDIKALDQLLNVLHPVADILNCIQDNLYPVIDILNRIPDILHPLIDPLHFTLDTLYALANTNNSALNVVRNPQQLQRRHMSLFQRQPVHPPQRIFDIRISYQFLQILFCKYVNREPRLNPKSTDLLALV